MHIIKRFSQWLNLKSKIHFKSQTPLFKEGEVWWCAIGENVGTEINGKSAQFSRPVYVLQKLNRYSALVVPATSKIKVGAWYYEIIIGDTKSSLNFAQIRNIDSKRLTNRIEELPSDIQAKIYRAFRVFSQNKKYTPTYVGGRGYSRKSSAHKRTDPHQR